MSTLKALRLTAMAVLLQLSIFAQDIPKPLPNTYIDDYVGILKQPFIGQFNALLHTLDVVDSIQMAIVIMDIPSDAAIEDYARAIGEQWHIGNYRNGIVFLWSPSTHKLRLEVARQLEPVITDVESKEILDMAKVFFKEQQYEVGIETVIRQTTATIHAARLKGLTQVDVIPKKSGIDWVVTVLCILGLGALVFLIWAITHKTPKAELEEDDHMIQPEDLKPAHLRDAYYNSPSPSSSVYPHKDVQRNTVIAPVIINAPSPTYYDVPNSTPAYSSAAPDSGSSWGGSDGGTSAGFDGGGATSDY